MEGLRLSTVAWRAKAETIIYKLCAESEKQANTRKDGKRYKKRRPYSVPSLAKDLVKCLGTDDEERAKAIFLSYDGMKAAKL
jgi:hypothetical protein